MLGRFPSLFEIVFVVGKHLHGILPILKKDDEKWWNKKFNERYTIFLKFFVKSVNS